MGRIAALIEGILFFAIGLVGIFEGIRLTGQRNPQIIYDVLGPGYYIIYLGSALMATGLIHLIVNYRKNLRIEQVAVRAIMKIKVILVVLVMVLYVFLIYITGYLIATIVFFFLTFWIMGVKPWRTTVMMTAALSAVYYIIFIKYLNMIFPYGIFFK
jgi:hypothetical protein